MDNSKICFKCSVEKPLSEFYKHSGMSDGHLNKCKECNRKDVKENREKNIDYYLEYDKKRASNPLRVKARLKYSQTDEGKAAARKAKYKWAVINTIKRAASHIVNNAIRDGKLFKPDICESCNEKHPRLHGHHDDYAYPMNVRWLCPQCHRNWHKENGTAING